MTVFAFYGSSPENVRYLMLYYILFAISTASTITPSLSSSQEHSYTKFKLKIRADKAMLG